MERAKEIGDQLLWLIGHLAFTLAVNLMVFGGYHAFQVYQSMQPMQIDISQLSDEGKEALASALVEDGFNVPRPEGKRKG